MYPKLHARFQDNWRSGSEAERFIWCLPYLSMVLSYSCDMGRLYKLSFRLLRGFHMFGFDWPSGGFQTRTSLKMVDGQTMDGRTPADVYAMSLSC